jgi:NADPH-dependent 2,4-dienoyl-CoA reductase/sulfur reductase-like enzyme
MRVAVVGAGPAGIRAVETLVSAGLRPAWIEESPDGGGRIAQRPPPGFQRDARALYGADAPRARALHATLDGLEPRVDWRPGTLVWNLDPRARRLHLIQAGRRGTLDYDRIILATGAMDRVVPLPGWTLPGVTTLGGAQVALKAQGVAVGARPVFLGTGPLLWLTALQYARAGAPPPLILDTTPLLTKRAGLPMLLHDPVLALRGLGLRLALLRHAPVHEDATPIAIEGGERVEAIRWRDAAWREHVTRCDAVAMGWGLKPETQLADLAEIPFAFDPVQRAHLPVRDAAGRSPVPGHYLAGDGARVAGAKVAEWAGARAALALLEDAGLPFDAGQVGWLDARLQGQARARAALENAFPYPARLAARLPDDTMLCRCEGVTAGQVRASAAPDLNRAKALTRLGMGRCQGRVCGPAGAEILAARRGVPVARVGRLRGQMPVKPIPMDAL